MALLGRVRIEVDHTSDGHVVGLCGSTGEDDFFGICRDYTCDLGSSGLDRLFGLPSIVVRPGEMELTWSVGFRRVQSYTAA